MILILKTYWNKGNFIAFMHNLVLNWNREQLNSYIYLFQDTTLLQRFFNIINTLIFSGRHEIMSCCLIVTQSGNSSKNGLLFDWLNKQPNDSVVYVSFRSGATLLHEQMIGRAICVIFLILRNVYFVIIRWLLQF